MPTHKSGHCKQFVGGDVQQLVEQRPHGSMDVNQQNHADEQS